MKPLQGIVQFNVDRKLESFSPAAEHAMLSEELQEFFVAYDNDNDYDMLDALCDIIVVATGAIYKMGYHPELALKQTVKEITSRKGSFNEELGKWQKDINQDPSTLYKADYRTARR
jgi:hypothetical protein